MALGAADFEDAGAELFGFFEAEAVDGFEFGEVLRAGKDDAAEGGRGENEEERQAEALGFGFAPVAETLVEGLLLGGEGVGGLGGGGAGAGEGFGGGLDCGAGGMKGALGFGGTVRCLRSG